MPASIAPNATLMAISRSPSCSRSAWIATNPILTAASSRSVSDGGECASCHSVNGWKPSTFTVKEHALSAYPLQGGHARLQCAQCHIPKGKETLFKIKFERCTDCHADKHAGQFAAAPYFNAVRSVPQSRRIQALHLHSGQAQTDAFVLTGGHIAVPCSDCHKNRASSSPSRL